MTTHDDPQEFVPEYPTPEQNTRWYNYTAPGTEGVRSATDEDWNWSWHNPAMVRAGPSRELQAQMRLMRRQFGPPPEDMEFYGEFDVVPVEEEDPVADT